MTKAKLLPLVFLFFSLFANAQNFTTYFTGDTTNVTTSTVPVTVLMGGATEHDSAMVWFLQNSGGGDVVVLRASGSNGYNAYMYSQLGVTINSVETIVCNNAQASTDPYIFQQLMNAEALWFAGGDQWKYVSYWNNTPIDTAINYLINVKKIPVGGTSADMAILSHIVNTAQNGSATSAGTLANPYVSNLTLLKDDFIFNPWLNNVVTDTHYDNPDRRGRHVAFMSRIMQDYGVTAVYGIACNEYVAACIDTNGLARVYGDYPNYQEFAYFLQANCLQPNAPETCVAAQPLTWNRNAEAVKVYKVAGTQTGANYFQLNNWNTGSGGLWEDWWVTNGILQVSTFAAPANCNSTTSLVENITDEKEIIVYPNPASDFITIINSENKILSTIFIKDVCGKIVLRKNSSGIKTIIDLRKLNSGIYFVVVETENKNYVKKLIKT